MKKLMIPVIAVIAGLAAAAIWHYVISPGRQGTFQPYQAGLNPTGQDSFADASGTPRLNVLGGIEWRLAEMELNRPYQREFIVENRGDGPLRLKLLSWTRDCKVPDLLRQSITVIDPQSSLPIRITCVPRNKSEGDYRGKVSLATNDPLRPVLDFHIACDQLNQVTRVIPRGADAIENWQQSETRSVEFDLVNFRDDQFEVLGHEFKNPVYRPYFELETDPLNEVELAAIKNASGDVARSGYRCRVNVQAGLPVGYVDQEIVVETSIEGNERFAFRVSGMVEGDVEIACQSGVDFDERRGLVDLGTIRPGESTGVQMALDFKRGKLVPPGLKVLKSLSAPNGLFTVVVEDPVTRSDGAPLVPLRIGVEPETGQLNLPGPAFDQLGRIVIGDGEGNLIAVIHFRGIFPEF